jgi:outer membrane protein OmpA-like peptidoglycan-associated protein
MTNPFPIAMLAFRISIVIGLFILSNSISEARLSLAAELLPVGLSTTAHSSWPSLTYLSPKERVTPNLTGEEFGYFPRVETGPLVATVEDSPVAGTRAGDITPARTKNALHSGTGTTVLGDLYLADDHPTVAAEAAELLASTALLLDRNPMAHLTLEAYCDERGTEAYSFLIGREWALDVERRLQEMRVEEKRVTTVSYGLQQPACQEDSRTCWEDNLRMKWSIRLLSPVTSQQGCLIRLKLATNAPPGEKALLATSQPYLRRIQQGEPYSGSSVLPFPSTLAALSADSGPFPTSR